MRHEGLSLGDRMVYVGRPCRGATHFEVDFANAHFKRGQTVEIIKLRIGAHSVFAQFREAPGIWINSAMFLVVHENQETRCHTEPRSPKSSSSIRLVMA